MIADRMAQLSTQFFASLEAKKAALLRAGSQIISLDVGSPDLPPHPEIIEVLVNAARQTDKHGYQSHQSPLLYRRAWSAYYKNTFDVTLDHDREILGLLGSKEGIFHLSLALINPGDIVLIPDPAYMTYLRGALAAGGIPYLLPLLPENDYFPDLTAIPTDIAQKSKLLWLNYPNNPTAAVTDLEHLKEAVTFARKNDILVCHDAAYAQVTYDGYRAPSILEVPNAKEVALEINTLSKSHNMAGWRVAAALGNPHAVSALHKIKTHADSGHFLPVLEAAAFALQSDQSWIVKRNLIYAERRDAALQGLQRLGLRTEIPKASFYIWFETPSGWSSVDFASGLLEQAGVSLTPGTVFGDCGEGFIRLSLTANAEQIKVAFQRIESWMNNASSFSNRR